MRLPAHEQIHLTYCTNIHPGNGWDAVFENVKRYAPALKAKFSPHTPFGIGLRLSAREARELLSDGRLARFHAFLDESGDSASCDVAARFSKNVADEQDLHAG